MAGREIKRWARLKKHAGEITFKVGSPMNAVMFAIIRLLATFMADLFKSRHRLEVDKSGQWRGMAGSQASSGRWTSL
jgi:hypothetical protein